MTDLIELYKNQLHAEVLDHGKVRLIDCMPRIVDDGATADSAIVDAARVSYGRDVLQQSGRNQGEDRKLIRYLMRHRHTSPFEQCSFKFYVKAPIFVLRQWHRHRTAKINEVSGRYTELSDDHYTPSQWRKQSTTNNQGGDESIPYEQDRFRLIPRGFAPDVSVVVEDAAGLEYARRIDSGVSRELARTCLPVSTYSEMVWKIDLHNLLHFLSLRMDSHAQQEIRVYAEEMYRMVQYFVPNTIEAFNDFRLNAMTLSGLEVDAIRDAMKENRSGLDKDEWQVSPIDPARSTPRERSEFEEKLFKLGIVEMH